MFKSGELPRLPEQREGDMANPISRPNLPILRCPLFVVNYDSTGGNAVSFRIPSQEMGSQGLSRDQPRLHPIFVIVGVRTDKGLSSMALAYQVITASQNPPEPCQLHRVWDWLKAEF